MTEESEELADQILKEMGERLTLGGEALHSLKGLWAMVRQHEISTGKLLIVYPPQRFKLERLTGIPHEEK